MKHLNVVTAFSRKLYAVQRINSTPLTRNRRHVDVRQKQEEKKKHKKGTHSYNWDFWNISELYVVSSTKALKQDSFLINLLA